jgi:hypothetical protein
MFSQRQEEKPPLKITSSQNFYQHSQPSCTQTQITNLTSQNQILSQLASHLINQTTESNQNSERPPSHPSHQGTPSTHGSYSHHTSSHNNYGNLEFGDKKQVLGVILDLKNKVQERELEILELKNARMKYDGEN